MPGVKFPKVETVWDFVHLALRGKWAGGGEWPIVRQARWFHRLKAAICLLLDREAGYDFDESVRIVYTNSGTYSSPGEPTVHWAEWIAVGHGVFENWWAIIDSDSD